MPPQLYESLLERLGGRQYSNYFACFCPFDTHKTPAMLVHDDGLFVCLSCGKKGTHAYLDKVIGSHFIPQQRMDTVSHVLPQWRKWEQKYDDLEGIADAAHKSLKRNPAFQTYFRKRKIYEYVEEGRLGYLDGWVLFPVISDKRNIIDIVVRSTSKHSDSRYVVHPSVCGDVRPLYCPSWEKVNQSETVYVVYGIIDSISLHLAGLSVVTGITGKSLSAELLKPLRKRFIILPDDGEEAEAHKLANSLGWRCSVKKLNWPENAKDCDDVRRMYGDSALLRFIGI